MLGVECSGEQPCRQAFPTDVIHTTFDTELGPMSVLLMHSFKAVQDAHALTLGLACCLAIMLLKM